MNESIIIKELNDRELSGRMLDIWEGRSNLDAITESQYRELWRTMAKNETGSRISLPCFHKGVPKPPPEGRDVRKSWFECEAGKGIVCECLLCGCACNSSCDKYVEDSDV